MSELNYKKIPVTLYIHMPWCEHKCPYCDFNSHALKQPLPEHDYVDCLIDDFFQDIEYLGERQIEAIFIGGGTPSLFSAASFERLLNILNQYNALSDDIEITLEANPGSSEQNRFAGYRAAGINRLSLGVQSLQDKYLQTLQRVHSASQALNAIDQAYQAGFSNLNVDLMHGLPNQLLEDALFDLELALKMKPKHLSWYELTLEPNTVFYRNPPELPSEDTVEQIQQRGHELLTQYGYQQYEVSAYCQPGFTSKHNHNYWLYGDYLGIGAGAHSKLTLPGSQPKILRQIKTRSPMHYLNQDWPYTYRQYHVDRDNRRFEFMLNALRLNEPVYLETFEQRTGMPADVIYPQLIANSHQGYLNFDRHCWQPTSIGKRYLNEIIQQFLPES